MTKEILKDRAAERQNGKSITGADLPVDVTGNLIHSHIDTHRPIPKIEGGKYTDINTAVALPTEHRDIHGNTPWLDDPELVELRSIMEDYRTCVKAINSINNKLLATERRMDEITPEIRKMFEDSLEIFITERNQFKRRASKQLDRVEHPMIPILAGIRGIGVIYVAEIITLINIEKARHASSLWSFAGYHTASKDRYQKGVKGGGHKHFRTVLFNLGGNFLKNNNEAYRAIYDARKARQEQSENIVRTWDNKDGWCEKAWKEVSKGHRHGDALRVMLKHFLADLWFVWREIDGLPTNDLYVKEHLGHASAIIDPRSRGWNW